MQEIIPQLINVTIFPGSRDDTGKTRMELQLVFDDPDQATAWLKRNQIPVEYLDRRPGEDPLPA